jgi:hypothetical protein
VQPRVIKVIKAVGVGWIQLERIKGQPGPLKVSSSAERDSPSHDRIPAPADAGLKPETEIIDLASIFADVIIDEFYAANEKDHANEVRPDGNSGGHVAGAPPLSGVSSPGGTIIATSAAPDEVLQCGRRQAAAPAATLHLGFTGAAE